MARAGGGGGEGTPIHYLYGYVPPYMYLYVPIRVCVVYKFMIHLTGRYVNLIKMAKLNGDKKKK